MKCIICQSEDIVEKEVMEEYKNENNIVYIPIKTQVCSSCGERYYNRRTMKLLEEMEKKIREHEIQLKEVGKVLMAS